MTTPPLGIGASVEQLRALAHELHKIVGDQHAWRANLVVGLDGVLGRMASSRLLVALITDWTLCLLPASLGVHGNAPLWTEAHAANLLFSMDSSFETLVYSANAIGFGIDQQSFRDVSDASELKQVGVADVLDPQSTNHKKSRPAPVGHETHFPRFTAAFRGDRVLVEAIMVQHDVSKHRHAGVSGGTIASMPPEHLGGLKVDEYPWTEILLSLDPKTPWFARTPGAGSWESNLLELAKRHHEFMKTALAALVSDVEAALASRRSKST